MNAYHQSKLTDDQKEVIAGYVADGISLREAATICMSKWGIQVSHVTLHSYDEIKRAIRIRDSVRTAETKETLDKSAHGVIKDLCSRMSRLKDHANKLEAALIQLQVGSPEYITISKELRGQDKVYNDLLKSFNSLVEKSQFANAQNDELVEKQDRKKRVEDMMAERGIARGENNDEKLNYN